MGFYAQRAPQWSKQLLGYNTDPNYNLGRFGCLITSWGNMLWKITGDAEFTPEFMNNWLKARNGFMPGGGIMYWSVPLGLGHVEAQGSVATLAEIQTWLKDGPNFAIIEVRTSAGGQHYVCGITDSTIIDADDGQIKPITTYRFVTARKYRAVGGQGAGVPAASPVISVPINNSKETVMNAAEEANAYRIMLGREDENPGNAPRTGYQFILDGAPELSAQRATAAAQVAAALDAANKAGEVNAALQAQVDSLSAQLAAAKTVMATAPAVPAVPANPLEATEVKHEITRVAQADGVMHDFSGAGLPDLEIKRGMVFKQFSTFTGDGVPQVRTQKSKDNDQWYGTPESLFDPVTVPAPELSKSDSVHLGASKLFGAIGRWVYNLTHKRKQ